MTAQSTNHIMMMEPVQFRANPQTRATNSYQHEDPDDISVVHEKAVQEFRAFRDLLVIHGVAVTTVLGQKGCPDDIFCNNWVSTHAGGLMTLYPMLAENRRLEIRDELVELLGRQYKDVIDLTEYEEQGQFLESTGSLCMDRVNKVAYSARSQRSHEDVARIWCDKNDFEFVPFDTEHRGKPVYHTDVVMWIGTDVVGICSECLKDKNVINKLSEKRDVIEFTNEQMASFCGNSLEVLGTAGEKMLVMSAAGYNALSEDQKGKLHGHYKTVIQPKIETIEYYGGGSARCMLLELY